MFPHQELLSGLRILTPLQTLMLFFIIRRLRRPLPTLTLLTHSLWGYDSDNSLPTYVRTLSPDLSGLTKTWDLMVSMQREFPWNF